MGKKEKKKEDLSKLDKKSSKQKSKKKKKEDTPNIDYSKLTDAEYEALFLERFNEAKSESDQKKQVILKPVDPTPSKSIQKEKPSSTVVKEINGKITNPTKMNGNDILKNAEEQPKYGATADFSWMDKPIEYIRHCPSCNHFLKTDISTDYNCPKCNTPMKFSINCKACNLWFDVKSAKKYPCPRCNRIISHGV